MTSREQKAAYRERSSNIIAVGERQSESRERGGESRERLQIQPRAPCPQQLPSLTQDDGQPVDQQHRSEMQKKSRVDLTTERASKGASWQESEQARELAREPQARE